MSVGLLRTIVWAQVRNPADTSAGFGITKAPRSANSSAEYWNGNEMADIAMSKTGQATVSSWIKALLSTTRLECRRLEGCRRHRIAEHIVSPRDHGIRRYTDAVRHYPQFAALARPKHQAMGPKNYRASVPVFRRVADVNRAHIAPRLPSPVQL